MQHLMSPKAQKIKKQFTGYRLICVKPHLTLHDHSDIRLSKLSTFSVCGICLNNKVLPGPKSCLSHLHFFTLITQWFLTQVIFSA